MPIAHRSALRTLVVMAMLFALSANLVSAAATPTPTKTPAKADPGPVTIAKGVADVPKGKVGWRVLERSVDKGGSNRDITGFVLADGANLNVALPSGDETAVPSKSKNGLVGADFVWGKHTVSANTENTPYIEIALVGSQENIIGDPFTISGDQRDFSMVAGIVKKGEQATLPASNYPVLLISLGGKLSITQGDSKNVPVADHSVLQLKPKLDTTVKISSNSGQYIAIYIGGQVKAATATPTSTESAATATATTEEEAIPTSQPIEDTTGDDEDTSGGDEGTEPEEPTEESSEPTEPPADTPTEEATSPASGDTPTDVPTDVPTEVVEPTEVPTDVPTEVVEPTDVPTDIPTDVPTEPGTPEI